ncbi:MAG TPA: hypothetical protein VIM16_22940 [Mucilaginibacter sp.]|jgi:hypothetical protein
MLNKLIDDQKIIIDAHKWGTGENISWDKSSNDIHIDKRTNRRIKNQEIVAHIKIPINSDHDISVEIVNNVRKPKQLLEPAERQIISEIRKALSNRKVREEFINSLIDTLQNYPTNLSSPERAEAVMRRLAKHFGLSEELKNTLIELSFGRIASISAMLSGHGKNFFINLNRENITIGEISDADYHASNGKGF